jgi:hypothetical protein
MAVVRPQSADRPLMPYGVPARVTMTKKLAQPATRPSASAA